MPEKKETLFCFTSVIAVQMQKVSLTFGQENCPLYQALLPVACLIEATIFETKQKNKNSGCFSTSVVITKVSPASTEAY